MSSDRRGRGRERTRAITGPMRDCQGNDSLFIATFANKRSARVQSAKKPRRSTRHDTRTGVPLEHRQAVASSPTARSTGSGPRSRTIGRLACFNPSRVRFGDHQVVPGRRSACDGVAGRRGRSRRLGGRAAPGEPMPGVSDQRLVDRVPLHSGCRLHAGTSRLGRVRTRSKPRPRPSCRPCARSFSRARRPSPPSR